MKKIMIIFMLFMVLPFYSSFVKEKEQEKTDNNLFVSKYETHGNNLSQEELRKYYIENNICPMSSGYDYFSQGVYIYEECRIHLRNKYPEYTWSLENSHSVSQMYGGAPFPINNNDAYVNEARNQVPDKANNTDAGCGPIAMINQFQYLGIRAGYYQFISNINNYSQKVDLAQKVLDVVDTYQMYDGVMTTPNDFIDGANNILQEYCLQVPKIQTVSNSDGSITEEIYYDDDTSIVVTGDVILNNEKDMDQLKYSIDQGMPVIWWTVGAEYLGDHYTNIYQYDIWTGIDENGQEVEMTMYKLCANWPGYGNDFYMQDFYVDENFIKEVSGGFIYFEENTNSKRVSTKANLCNLQSTYSNGNTGNIVSNYDADYQISYSGLAYTYNSNCYNYQESDKYMILSAIGENRNSAYLQLNFTDDIKYLYFDVGWYSNTELLNSTNGDVQIQYKNYNDEWVIFKSIINDNISNTIDDPTHIKVEFPYSVDTVRIYLCYNGSEYYEQDLGRLCVSDMYCEIEKHRHYETLEVTQFNDTHHKRYCMCGYYKIEIHAVSSDYQNSSFGPCVACGYIIHLDEDDKFFDNILSNNILVTKKGSYKLSNGIIILMQEDLETYNKNELIFYLSNQSTMY